MKIKTSSQTLEQQPQKYVRIVFTQDQPHQHRFIETSNGTLEIRWGIGKWAGLSPRKFRTLVRSIIQSARQHGVVYLTLTIPAFPQLPDRYWVMRTFAENTHLAAYEFTAYKTKTKQSAALKEIVICGALSAAEKRGLTTGEIVAKAMNTARDIINTPACDMTPTELARAEKQAVAGTTTTVRALGEKQLTKLKMGALLAVGQGSRHESKLIIIEYWGGSSKKTKPIVLVGKGITYDTGGLNVKPTGAMHDMYMDMGGGGAIIGTMAAIAKLKLKKNVVAIIPTAENAISDQAMRAGDIITTMSGQTVEIVHTDAEGRLVLADALTYATRYHPDIILDVATLTGASIVALGQHTSAVMTSDSALQQKLIALGEESGDLLWPLPLWEEYRQHIKSTRADIANIAPNFSKFGGAIEGGTFLSHFAPKNVRWAHLDIAPRMTSIPADKLAKGATGEPVRMLVRFVEQS